MELLVLLGILALLLLGPRRGGRMPGRTAVAVALALLGWLALTFLLGWRLRDLLGNWQQP